MQITDMMNVANTLVRVSTWSMVDSRAAEKLAGIVATSTSQAVNQQELVALLDQARTAASGYLKAFTNPQDLTYASHRRDTGADKSRNV